MDRRVRCVADVVERGVLAGEIKKDPDPEAGDGHALDPYEIAVFLYGVWNGLLALSLREDKLKVKESEFQRIARTAESILRFGLKARG